ncbi:MAG: rubrerythrin family protein [Candidatus Korarchaeota archaeon]|nr:rubrerythrin family protein [Candidatus Korarchaeota archaeon]NIU84095.1 rubrerythrin family protein [Candidatus Thorarchaeota archaeon]NIW14239.1 rubrerythrin family protein [Candidatus Thorarchaeota archaeon]NIW52331.1 rubrerythrin family protein [Candidatus Korarchaeota archaeon]
MLQKKIEKQIVTAQKNEITEQHIYKKLSRSIKDPHNKEVLQNIAIEEKEHYEFWKQFTQKDVKPSKWKVFFYVLISKIFGITFGIKLMERGEEDAQVTYEKISESIPEAKEIVEEEDEHEDELIAMINEERLNYIGSIIRGLNDALVELTGALTGLTFVLKNTILIGTTGLITGIAASLSMAGSEYLSHKSEERTQRPGKAAFYTGFAYIVTVAFLIFPYLWLMNVYFALIFMIVNAIVVIFIITFYISVAQDLSFKARFGEMSMISLGIAALTFVIGFLIRTYFGVEL